VTYIYMSVRVCLGVHKLGRLDLVQFRLIFAAVQYETPHVNLPGRRILMWVFDFFENPSIYVCTYIILVLYWWVPCDEESICV
jgi:hypothetical protein